jgi:hypothetical protein
MERALGRLGFGCEQRASGEGQDVGGKAQT